MSRQLPLLLLAAALLAAGAAAARHAPEPGGSEGAGSSSSDEAPLPAAGPVSPELAARVRATLILVHRAGAGTSELAAAARALRGGALRAERTTRVAIGDGFQATLVESAALARGDPAAKALVSMLTTSDGLDVASAAAAAEGLATEGLATAAHSAVRAQAAQLRAAGGIDNIERDAIVRLSQDGSGGGGGAGVASWGLDRIDQEDLPLDSNYAYPAAAGAGVVVYVLDTGVNVAHSDFGGRASCAISFIKKARCVDENGHGTHVSGTIGGAKFGVAKKATIVGVRVLDASGSGSYSGIISALNWAVNHCGGRRCVINMSVGGGYSAAVNLATQAAVNKGLIVAVAAGNSYDDACRYSPAATPGAITVGATTQSDTRARFSNWGTCVDVYAPGSSITSTWIGSDSATAVLSGTSMATPHVAGAAALLWSKNLAGQSADAIVALLKRGAPIPKVMYNALSADYNQNLLYVA